MDNTKSAPDLLCDALVGRFNTLEGLVERLSSCLPPYGAKRFAKFAKWLVSGAKAKLQESLQGLPKTDRDSMLMEVVRTYSRVADRIHEIALPYLVHDSRATLPCELIPTLLGVARKYVPSLELALEPWCYYNYQVMGAASTEFVEDIWLGKPEAEEYTKSFEWIILLSFPHIEEGDALHHPLFIHEVGHLVDRSKELAVGLDIQPDGPAIEALAEQLVRKMPHELLSAIPEPGKLKEQYVKTIKSQAVKVLSDWAQELAADSFAISVCGPAYFFAFADLSYSRVRPDRHSDSHPAPNFRLRKMIEQLERNGYLAGDFACGVIPQRLREWQGLLPAKCEATGIVHDLVERSLTPAKLAQLEQQVKNCVSGDVLTAARFIERVPTLVDRLTRGVIPVEDHFDGRSATVFDIFNAGWVLYLSRLPEFEAVLHVSNEEQHYGALANLSELLLKSVQLAEVSQRWRSMRGG